MITVAVQIGNSDDKLSQRDWSFFVSSVGTAIESTGIDTHFSGVSYGAAPWQNACWLFEFPDQEDGMIDKLIGKLKRIRIDYKQESIALTRGSTIFI
jgi:hypothetical protein